MSVGEDGGPLEPFPHDFVYSVLPIVMASAFFCMEFLNEPLFLLLIHTVQQHPSWLLPIQFSLQDAEPRFFLLYKYGPFPVHTLWGLQIL